MSDETQETFLSHLIELDRDIVVPFVGLLERPHEVASRIDVATSIRSRAIDLAQQHGMTPSQLAAFEGVVDQGLRLVWGRPVPGRPTSSP